MFRHQTRRKPQPRLNGLSLSGHFVGVMVEGVGLRGFAFLCVVFVLNVPHDQLWFSLWHGDDGRGATGSEASASCWRRLVTSSLSCWFNVGFPPSCVWFVCRGALVETIMVQLWLPLCCLLSAVHDAMLFRWWWKRETPAGRLRVWPPAFDWVTCCFSALVLLVD